MRVSRKIREGSNVVSLDLAPVDGHPLAVALSGQFIVMRIKSAPDAPALTRGYSPSGEPSTERYRVSVKQAHHGTAGAYINEKLEAGDVFQQKDAKGWYQSVRGIGGLHS